MFFRYLERICAQRNPSIEIDFRATCNSGHNLRKHFNLQERDQAYRKAFTMLLLQAKRPTSDVRAKKDNIRAKKVRKKGRSTSRGRRGEREKIDKLIDKRIDR